MKVAARGRRLDTKPDVRRGCGVIHVIAAVEHARLVAPCSMIPGRMLHRLAARLCSARTLERSVEPAIADLQQEFAGAGGVAGRVWILLTGYFAILKVIAICVGSVSVETDEERRTLVRTLQSCALMVAVILVMLIVPPLINHPRMGWRAATTLVPQAMALSVPIGIAFGLAFGLSARPTMNLAKATLGGALAASAFSFVILAWGVPAANEAFREITFRELRARGYQGPVTGPQKGYSEMTLSELRGEIAHFSAGGELLSARKSVFRLHLRFALAAATFALASLLLAAPVNHRGLRGLLAFTVCLVYWMLMFAGDVGSRRGYLTPPLGAWLPNLVLLSSAIVIASLRSSRLRGSHTPAR